MGEKRELLTRKELTIKKKERDFFLLSILDNMWNPGTTWTPPFFLERMLSFMRCRSKGDCQDVLNQRKRRSLLEKLSCLFILKWIGGSSPFTSATHGSEHTLKK